MTQSATPEATMPQPSLSMFDVYSGYVLTQGCNALQNVVMWERVMRLFAWGALLAVAALWLAPDGASGPQVLPFKILLSAVLGAMAAMLFWSSRSRPQYEVQIDLIHCELRQVMRAASGIERLMLRVDFDKISGLYVRQNRSLPAASCLFAQLDGIEEAVLLGVGEVEALTTVHRRLAADLAKARSMPRPPRPRSDDRMRAVSGMQAA